nr:ROK family transcriptional regulator [Dickeya dianthicola]
MITPNRRSRFRVIVSGQPGHIDQIKQINAGGVYRLIDENGPISRIELSKRAQLAPASITKIVRELMEAHLVRETEYQDMGSRGRPAIGLVLDTEAWHYLSVRISNQVMTLALRDLSGHLVVEEWVDLPTEHPQSLLERILAEIDQFFIRHQRKLERLTAIAITSPGMVDSSTGIIHRMPFYDVEEMAIGPALEKRTGVPVYLQHDICAWTMAEALFGASRGCQNVIQIVIDHNVGAGVITGGRILHAGSRTLVEIGHTQVDPYGKRCYCGNHGCLETVASIESMLELAQQRLNGSMSSLLHGSPLTVASLCDAALKGDQLAKDIIVDVGNNVGRITAIMVNLFNPEKILIGSPLNQAADILHPAIIDCIHRQALPAYSHQLQVTSTHFYNQGTVPGAALIKDALYNGSLLIKLLQG